MGTIVETYTADLNIHEFIAKNSEREVTVRVKEYAFTVQDWNPRIDRAQANIIRVDPPEFARELLKRGVVPSKLESGFEMFIPDSVEYCGIVETFQKECRYEHSTWFVNKTREIQDIVEFTVKNQMDRLWVETH